MLSTTRKLFEALAIFGWPLPLFKIAEGIVRDPPFVLNSWTFYLPNDKSIRVGYSQRRVKELLRQNGIDVYSDIVNFGEIQFCVPLSQAAKAERILNGKRIPIQPRSRNAPRR